MPLARVVVKGWPWFSSCQLCATKVFIDFQARVNINNNKCLSMLEHLPIINYACLFSEWVVFRILTYAKLLLTITSSYVQIIMCRFFKWNSYCANSLNVIEKFWIHLWCNVMELLFLEMSYYLSDHASKFSVNDYWRTTYLIVKFAFANVLQLLGG